MIYPLFFSFLSSILNYFSERISELIDEKRMELISFSSGISIVYIFLFLLPEITRYAEIINVKYEYFIILLGFILLHLVEKLIYKHSRSIELRKELKFEHSIAFFIYHFLVGIIFVKLFQTTISRGVLFGITILFHSAISGLSMQEIHYHIRESEIMKIILSSSTILGTITGLLLSIPNKEYYALLSFITGVIFYVIIRDALPEDRKGKPLFFMIGVLFYTIIFLLINLF